MNKKKKKKMTPKKEDKLQEVAHPANARIHTLMTQLYPRYLTFIIIIIVIIIIIITIAKSYSPFIKQGVSFLILPLFLSLIYNFISFFILSSLCISLFVQLFLIEFMKCTRNTLAKEKKKKNEFMSFFYRTHYINRKLYQYYLFIPNYYSSERSRKFLWVFFYISFYSTVMYIITLMKFG